MIAQSLMALPIVAVFVQFARAVRRYFIVTRMPWQMLLISGVGLLNLGWSLWSLFHEPMLRASQILGLAIIVWGWLVFERAKAAHADAAPAIAYSGAVCTNVVESGIYSKCRHPFYVSYGLYWLGLLIVVPTIASAVFCSVLLSLYAIAAIREERDILRSGNGDAYRSYMSRVNRIWTA